MRLRLVRIKCDKRSRWSNYNFYGMFYVQKTEKWQLFRTNVKEFCMFKKFVCIKQHDITDCGAACLAIVTKQHGLTIPIAKIREMAGTDQKGTNALGLIKAAESLGLSGKGVRAELVHLTKHLPLPCIAHVVKDNLQHYVVIHEIQQGQLTIADPAEGLVSYSIDEFSQIWTGILLLLVPADNFQRKDETVGLYERFAGLLLPQKGLLIQIFLASVIYTLFGLVGAFYFKTLIDEILVDGLAKTLHVVSAGFILLSLFKIVLDAFRNHLLVYLSQKIDIALMLRYYQHVLALPMSFFDSRRVGEILSRLSDASKIRAAISGATLSVMLDSLMVLVGGVVLYTQNRTLFGVATLFVPFYFLVLWAFNRPYRKVQRKSMEQAADLESYLVESLNGVSTIKALGGEMQAQFDTETRFIRLLRTNFSDACLRNIQGSLQATLTIIGELIILWVGGLQIINGNMSIGQLITFNALLAYFFRPIANLAGLQPMLQEAYIAGDRLGEILDLEGEKYADTSKVMLKKLLGQLELVDVSFRYGTRDLVLKNITLSVRPGEKVAFVGQSGSGKTTLAKLILNYYQPTEGEIVIDGYNLQDVSLVDLRARIGYVPQDIFLFSGTIAENIGYGLSNVKMQDILKLAKTLDTHQFINELPLRYETLVGERGASLSGGQRQRIAIMRAMLKKPDLLILDEATSNLDSETERVLHQALDQLSKDTTTIIIAHRLSTIKKCDKIMVFQDGHIVEGGTHQELIKKLGAYYQLWQGQIYQEVI